MTGNVSKYHIFQIPRLTMIQPLFYMAVLVQCSSGVGYNCILGYRGPKMSERGPTNVYILLFWGKGLFIKILVLGASDFIKTFGAYNWVFYCSFDTICFE